MALGGLLAISDRRYRVLARKQRQALDTESESTESSATPKPAVAYRDAEAR